ncbi:MAG TPA: serine/threonine-protein kinase [Gemmatimonadaceae bacterium]
MDDVRTALAEALGASYSLEDELIGGGMSRVFTAREIALGRRVAVKVLPPELGATLSIERFNREIVLSASLQHPHIVPVLSAGIAGGLPFYVMPLVEGESLRARLARGPISVREAVSILRDVSRALVYAHGRGIVHRDIKPDNILLSAGTATVTDFGLAKAVIDARGPARTKQPATSAITRIGTSIGTPAYMAPEQAAGDPSLDLRADLYALGVVAYEMLVGTPPFHGRPPQQLLAAQLTEKPPPIEARRYDVPESLVALINRLLEKSPEDRPRSAAEVARSFESPDLVSGAFASAKRTARKKGPLQWITALVKPKE